MELNRLCVFAGASPGVNPAYTEAAVALGGELARRRIGLVYGGSSKGLMGAVADAALAGGGEAIGVIPEGLATREVAHTGLTELRVVGSMHERKALMAELADAFLALPGGLGTLEELLEVATWTQLAIHAKPCGVLNVEGYFDPLVAMLERAAGEGFVTAEHHRITLVDRDIGSLLTRIAGWEPLRTDWRARHRLDL